MKHTVVMAFGRMNPPTAGHSKLIDKVHEVAKKHDADHEVILSHSRDKRKNPLTPERKLKHAKRMFPGTNISLSSKEAPTFLHHAKRLSDAGYKHLVMIAGSDRAKDYEQTLKQYNGKLDSHNFTSIKVVSAGHRDPDAEGVEGLSASKMRSFAAKNDFENFVSGLPSHMPRSHSRALYNDVRKGLKESVLEKLFSILRG